MFNIATSNRQLIGYPCEFYYLSGLLSSWRVTVLDSFLYIDGFSPFPTCVKDDDNSIEH